MTDGMLYVSHGSALHYWRTNPPWYVLEGAAQNIRSVRNSPRRAGDFDAFALSELEFGPPPWEVLVPMNAPRCPGDFHRHEQRAALPPHSLLPIRDGIHVVSPELCLVQLCIARDFLDMLEIGMEFCGTYSLGNPDDGGARQRDYALTSARACQRHFGAWKRITGIDRARKVARYLADGSASPMETKLYLLLCLPRRYGGFNLPVPELNPGIPLDTADSLLLRKQNVHPDMLWRAAKVVVEYDGAYHDDEGQSVQDEMRKTVLESMGYTVFRLKRWQLFNPLAFDGFATAVAKCLGKRLSPLTLAQSHQRDELRRRLLEGDPRNGR